MTLLKIEHKAVRDQSSPHNLQQLKSRRHFFRLNRMFLDTNIQ